MIVVTALTFIFALFIWSQLKDIRTELTYRNTLQEEHNKILERQNEILSRKLRRHN